MQTSHKRYKRNLIKMIPRYHVLLGFIFSYIFVYFFNFSLFAGFIIFLSSIFIDLDHVLLYCLEKKNLHPRKFFAWGNEHTRRWYSLSKEERENYQSPHFILHGIEFVAILIIFSFYHNFFLWVLFGVLFHLFLDLIDLYCKRDIHHFSLKTSQIWLWKRNRQKKKFRIDSI